jgi:hypothetical protein
MMHTLDAATPCPRNGTRNVDFPAIHVTKALATIPAPVEARRRRRREEKVVGVGVSKEGHIAHPHHTILCHSKRHRFWIDLDERILRV